MNVTLIVVVAILVAGWIGEKYLQFYREKKLIDKYLQELEKTLDASLEIVKDYADALKS